MVGSSRSKVWSARDASTCHQRSGKWGRGCGEATGKRDEKEPGEDNRKTSEGRRAGGSRTTEAGEREAEKKEVI